MDQTSDLWEGSETARPVPTVVALDDPRAADPDLTGAKAAALSVALGTGLAALPGAVLTTAFAREIDAGSSIATHPAVAEAFALVGGPERALVARSSSVAEDQAGSSMAGQFASVIGVRGRDELTAAIEKVLDSRAQAGAAGTDIAVLVQPLLEPLAGGVLFGVDPVSGRSDRVVVTAVAGAPEPLVSGEVDGSRFVLDLAGRPLETHLGDGPSLSKATLGRLAALAATAADVFGGPQDVEWAVESDDHIVLLQSRPVTSEVRGTPSGPIYGPGPVAETFPEELGRLESDLWVPPLRDAVGRALVLSGAATEHQLQGPDLVVDIGGRIAIDLQRTGEARPRPTLLQRLNPIPPARRLRSAWRVGRLRAALPALADDLLDRTDADLEQVPPIAELTSRQLVALIGRGREVLRSLHAHEILLGLLAGADEQRLTSASVALRVLAEGRKDGLDDPTILGRSPVVLALTAPRVAGTVELPPDVLTPDIGGGGGVGSDAGVLREALRLRVRWVQELTGRAAWALGQRLADSGTLEVPEQVRQLAFDEVEAMVTRRAVPIWSLLAAGPAPTSPGLPACFQVSDLGLPIAVRRADEDGGGTGAGGGVGQGPVTHDTTDPPPGAVLVTTTLTPGLGHLLPRLGGIVAETGSVLAHLAILARESGVPTVVAFPGAGDRFPPGTSIRVDGSTGDVTILEEEHA